MPKRSLCGLVLLLVLCVAAEPATGPGYPDTKEGLTQMFKDILAASADQDVTRVLVMFETLHLKDPDEWFKRVFGDERGTKLAAEYAKDMKTLTPALARLFLSLKEPKELTVIVTKFENSDDPNAKAYQRLQLAAMKDPTALYTVKVSKEGTNATITLWSMVYSDGGFRFAGKMRAIRDGPVPGGNED